MSDAPNTSLGARDWDNTGTLVALPGGRGAGSLALEPRVAFVAAYARTAELARDLPQGAFVVAAVDPVGRVAGSAVLGARERLIVGRHTECDLRLDEGTVSLRHLAVLLRHEGDAPALHVWDLATGTPFQTEEGVLERALVSTGPLYVAIDGYALWFLPTGGAGRWPESAAAAFDALPARTFIRKGLAPGAKPPRREAVEGYRVPARPKREESLRTLVSSVEPPLALALDEHAPEIPEIPFGTLALEAASLRKRYVLSAERLERGVLLGRYGRCDLLALTDEGRISRVHAMIVRLGGEVWLLDTASTNGTTRCAAPIRGCVLADGDRLVLADELAVTWRRLVHPVA